MMRLYWDPIDRGMPPLEKYSINLLARGGGVLKQETQQNSGVTTKLHLLQFLERRPDHEVVNSTWER